MHPDINDFEDSENETVQWDENTTYSVRRSPDVLWEEDSE